MIPTPVRKSFKLTQKRNDGDLIWENEASAAAILKAFSLKLMVDLSGLPFSPTPNALSPKVGHENSFSPPG